MPRGQAWPRRSSTLVDTITGLSFYWGDVDGRAADLLETEGFPKTTVEMIDWWERAWGLPDPCFPDASSISERQNMLVLQMTLVGGQSRAFFEQISLWTGYKITISEWSPFTCGISQCGDTRDASGRYRWHIGAPWNRFYWSVSSDNATLEWFRAGAKYSQAGLHPHCKIRNDNPIACLLERWKPAHTEIVNIPPNLDDPWAGLP